MDYQMEELIPIVSELAREYAGCDSTSVTYEKAQSFMEAVLFCLSEYNHSYAGSPDRKDLFVQNLSVKEQYDIGVKRIFEKVEAIREIFNEVSLRFEDYGVRILYDTVQNGIPYFLKWYDVKFCPQDAIITLDYPTLTDCGSLAGADAVCQYIRAIRTEQSFLNAFDRNFILSVLERYDPEYRDMAENICSIVLTGMVRHIAIRKPFQGDGFSREECMQLSKRFEGKSGSDIEAMVRQSIQKIVGRFFGNDTDMLEYLCCEAHNIAVRIDIASRHGQL